MSRRAAAPKPSATATPTTAIVGSSVHAGAPETRAENGSTASCPVTHGTLEPQAWVTTSQACSTPAGGSVGSCTLCAMSATLPGSWVTCSTAGRIHIATSNPAVSPRSSQEAEGRSAERDRTFATTAATRAGTSSTATIKANARWAWTTKLPATAATGSARQSRAVTDQIATTKSRNGRVVIHGFHGSSSWSARARISTSRVMVPSTRSSRPPRRRSSHTVANSARPFTNADARKSPRGPKRCTGPASTRKRIGPGWWNLYRE